MKKFWSVPLVLMASTLLVACGTDESGDEAAHPEEMVEETEVSASETSEESSDSVEEEDTSEEQAEAEPNETESDEEEPNEEDPQETEAAESGEVSEAFTADETTESEPVPLGEWGQVYLYSTADSQEHPAYLRITQVTTESEDPDYIQSTVDEHNELAEYDFEEIYPDEAELPADIEWLVVDYEIYYPEEFPPGEYGIQRSKTSLSAQNPDGGGIPSQDGTSVYIALGTPEYLMVDSTDTMEPGDTQKGRNLYTMVIDYEDYIFELLSNLPNDEGYETIYFGIE